MQLMNLYFMIMLMLLFFPSKGKRPDAHKMGTGDLDGDLYWINWNPKLVNDYKEYEPSKPEIDKKNIASMFASLLKLNIEGLRGDYVNTDEDLNRIQCINNFCKYIKNDILGQVANLHMKIADKDKNNVFGFDCLQLSKMHCQAVDAQKHDTEIDTQLFFNIK